MAKNYPQPEQDDGVHPWASLSQLFPGDIFLRAAGYVIHSRPKYGPVLWRDPWGGVVTERDAMEMATTAVEVVR